VDHLPGGRVPPDRRPDPAPPLEAADPPSGYTGVAGDEVPEYAVDELRMLRMLSTDGPDQLRE
jgi:hypothetical protein